MSYNKQTSVWDDIDDNDDEIGCCENCGRITVVFTSNKDGKTYCLGKCDKPKT
jgi:hypothetical protein